jgi:hypothetical protein
VLAISSRNVMRTGGQFDCFTIALRIRFEFMTFSHPSKIIKMTCVESQNCKVDHASHRSFRKTTLAVTFVVSSHFLLDPCCTNSVTRIEITKYKLLSEVSLHQYAGSSYF